MADVTVDTECDNPKELFGQGVRAFVLQDYESAVAALGKTSELLVLEHKDDLHDSLGEVYLYYGKALLGLSREQNEALGDAVPKNSTEDSEEDEEPDEGIESEESDKNKTEDNSVSSSVNGKSKLNEGKIDELSNEDGDKKVVENDSEMETKDEEEGESSKPDSSIGNGDSGPSCSKGEDDDGDEANDEQNGDDDASDLQLAWEVLELAKKIFQKLDDKKSLADTLIVLGEVSLESENFESAINDIKQGLEIQKVLFSKDSRGVAETLYKLGMAYSTNSQIDEAVESFNHSLDYLRNRIKTLEEIKSMTQEHKDEVEEIKGLIPDIEDKIADMKIYKEEAIKKVVEAFKEPPKPTQDGAAGSSKQVTNISHLVKRKRKLDEVEDKSTDDVTAKKPATLARAAELFNRRR